MDISLLHAGLAGGAALAALPVILHLFMKQTPKHVIFPALRLIRERQKRSRKKLRVKNWLLLLARMALVALMALALARPSLFSQSSLGDQEVPTALGLVFDTSLSMGYKEKDKTRLDEAKDRAYEILKKMPDTSQVFVVDSAEPGVPPPLTPASARKRIEGLQLRASNRTLNPAMGQVYTAVADSERPRHEVYVLTDLAQSAWDPNHPAEGLDKLKKVKTGVSTYVLRLAPKDVRDVAVIEAEPSSSVATQGQTVEIRARVVSRGPATARMVEFFLDGVKKGEKRVEFTADGEAEARFVTPKLDPDVPIHQGYVRVSGAPDPLEFDDKRFFTFKVQPAVKVLAVSDLPLDAEFVADALDPNPTTLPPGTPRSFQVDRIKSEQFADRARNSLKDYACVFLLNVAELAEADWGHLGTYLREGGGVVIGLGHRCRPENYRGPTAAQVVPAAPESKVNPPEDMTFGKVADFNHPLFNRYSKELDSLLSKVPVYHYWSVKPSEGARTLMSYLDNAPVLIERTFKGSRTGRALLWTTPLSRRPDRELEGAWNEFPSPFLGWSFFYLMNQTVSYMAGTSGERLNYESGEDVILPVDPTRRFKSYSVKNAEGKETESFSPQVTSDALVIVAPQPYGQWKVKAASEEPGKGETLGFSVNPPLSETRFVAMERANLDAVFGKAKYALADDTASLEHVTAINRIGHEVFPWLMFLILALVTAENFLANRFYRENPRRTAVGAPA
jgi:hypothetical protein